MRNNDIVYKLVIADLQKVANEYLNRTLTEAEVTMLSDEIGDHINWYDAVHNAMTKLGIE